MKPLVVALGGRVLGIDPRNGVEIWRNEMLLGGLEYVAIAVSDSFVVASASAARIFCIDRETGETKWSEKTGSISTKDIYQLASKQTVMVVCHR